MSLRLSYQGNNEIGVYARLTNTYCLVSRSGSETFAGSLEAYLGNQFPVVRCAIADTGLIGSMTVGNSRGLLVASTVTEQELLHIRNSIPDSVVIQRVEERLSALGNVICTNDKVALVHVDLDKETEEIIADVLGVETFRAMVNSELLVGSYCSLTNQGGVVHCSTPKSQIQELADLVDVPLAPATINRGKDLLSAGLIVNDSVGFVGAATTAGELRVIDKIFKFDRTGLAL